MEANQLKKNLLSIVVPVYNDATRLGKSLEKICNQSYPLKQVIVIDDGSEDQSYLIAEKYRKKYPFIEITQLEKNQGVVNALNVGLDLVKGEYVYLASSNDFVRDGFFENAMNLLTKYPQAGFYAGNINAVLKDYQKPLYCYDKPETKFVSSQAILRGEFKNGLKFFGQASIFRKKYFDALCKKLNSDLKWCSDLFCYFILSSNYGFILSKNIDCDADHTGGYSFRGSTKERHEVFQTILQSIPSKKNRNLLQKSGLLAHLGPRFLFEVLKSPSNYGFIRRNYLIGLGWLIWKKIFPEKS